MRIFGFLATFFGLTCLLFYVAPLHAQQGNPCDKATNTTDILSCAKERYETAQKNLSEIYALVEEQLKELQQTAQDDQTQEDIAADAPTNTALNQLSSNQKDWIAYRDAHCLWASEQADNESLKRIASLSCLAMMTESRTQLLQKHTAEDSAEEIVAQNTATPRWINVLGEEKPHIFWKNAKRQTLDLDCDGQDNFAVYGIDEASTEYVIALAQSAVTGRPDVTFLDVPKENETSCAPDDLVAINDQDAEDALCNVRIDIKGNHCEHYYITYTDGAFIIADRRDDALAKSDLAKPPLPAKKSQQ